MAKFNYLCDACLHRKMVTKLPEGIVECHECGADMRRVFKFDGGVSIVERLDNGMMGRAVERLHNIEDIITKTANDDTQRRQEILGE